MRRDDLSVLSLLIIVFALWSGGGATWLSAAALAPSPQHAATRDTTKTGRVDLKLLPILFTSPDTRLAFGVLPQLVFTAPNSERQSRGYVAAYYTLNKQYAISLSSSLWLNRDRDNLEVMVETRYWPTDFYGLGSRTMESRSEELTQLSTSFLVSASRSVGKLLRFGFSVSVTSLTVRDTDPGGELQSDRVPGAVGGWVVGLGPTIGIDTRDHVFYPSSGSLVKLGLVRYGGILGGDYSFSELSLDGRTYVRISNNQVIGLQGVLNLQTDESPFWKMTGIGKMIRGFETTRFVDRNMAGFQIEYRVVPVFWRLGFSVFVGLGTVAPDVRGFSDARFHPAAGFGLRYRYMVDAMINIRWDFGFARDSYGDYLEMGEAF